MYRFLDQLSFLLFRVRFMAVVVAIALECFNPRTTQDEAIRALGLVAVDDEPPGVALAALNVRPSPKVGGDVPDTLVPSGLLAAPGYVRCQRPAGLGPCKLLFGPLCVSVVDRLSVIVRIRVLRIVRLIPVVIPQRH